MKKKSLLLVIVVFLTINLVFPLNPPVKEALLRKVSFFSYQDTTKIFLDYSKIVELYQKKSYTETLQKSLDFIDNHSSKILLNANYIYEVHLIIGDIYRKNNNHTKSISYYKKALEQLKNFDINLELRGVNHNSKFLDTYLKIGNEFLRNSQKDSAKKYYTVILKTSFINDLSLSIQASASSNLSGLYRQDSLFDLAKEYALKAVNFHKKRKNKVSEAATKGNLASIYLDENNYSEAKKNYKEALDLIENETSERALVVKEKLYFNLAFNLYKLKDYEAYSYQEKSYLIKDSLRNKEIRQMIEELGFKHDFDTQKKLLEQKQEVTLLKEREKTRNIITIGVSILMIFLVIIGFSMMRQKNLQLKLSRTQLLQEQKIEKIKSESQVRILNATIDGKESERKDIAETLHDNVSALLSSASLHLQATKNQFNGSTPVEIEKTLRIINEAAEKIRDLSHTLVSSVLLKFGLKFAIREMAEKYTNSELHIITQIDTLRRYQQNFEIKTYNIIQELINNVIKHSQANNALIKISEQNHTILLVISDDGIGFDKTQILSKDGIGINQIEARIQMMKGSFFIDSKHGKGTKIKIELPIQEREIPVNVDQVL